MTMKSFSSAMCLALVMFSTQHAFAKTPMVPEACPAVSAIASVGVDVAESTGENKWVAARLSDTFNTSDTWTFGVGEIEAENAEDALAKAAKLLPTLDFIGGPVNIGNLYGCLYQASDDVWGVAISPAFTNIKALKTMRYSFKK